MLYRLSRGNVCFGIVTDVNGIVVRAADISKWGIGKHGNKVLYWWSNKGYRITIIEDGRVTGYFP